MEFTEKEALERVHQTLEEVNRLFSVISTLPAPHQENVLDKLRQEISKYDAGTFKCENLTGTLQKCDNVGTRVSLRAKKLTPKAQVLLDEAKAQSSEEKIKKIIHSSSGIASVETGSVRPCFVKLVPLQESSEGVIADQNVVPNHVTEFQEMKSFCDEIDYNFEEDVDSPILNSQDEFVNSSRRKSSSGSIQRSWKTANNNKQNFRCNKCGKSFRQKSGLDIHLKRHNGVKTFACALCEYKAVCKIEILRHMSKHTGERNYPCKMCGKNFTSDCSLRNHVKHVHVRSDKSICAHCSFQTHSKDILKRHYLIKHTNYEHFECPVCHEMIKQKGTFMIHMRKHTGERPYQCTVCTKCFKSSSQLAAHRRTHRPGEYSCVVCSRHFKTKHQLNRHKIIHTGDKPYSCHLCNYACNVKANITKHVRAVHKMSSFTFKEPKSKSTGPSDNPDALKRGHKAADEYLQEHTVKVGEILTLEDLQRQSTEKREYQENLNLDECKGNPDTSNGLPIPGLPVSLPNSCSSDNRVLEACENVNNEVESSSSLIDSCTSDILSSAVQLLNSSVQNVGLDECDGRYKCDNETVSIPVEIGPNMYIIQVVSDRNVSL